MAEFRRPMSPVEAFYNAVTGLSPRSEGRTTKQRAEDLVKRMGGSTRAAAAAAGVSQRTVQKWLKGDQEAKNTRRSNNADRLAAAQRTARIQQGRADKMKAAATGSTGAGPGSGLKLYGTVKVSDDIRDRWIKPGSKIPHGALDDLIDKMAEHGAEAIGDDLNRLIQGYVQGMTITNIEAIEFD